MQSGLRPLSGHRHVPGRLSGAFRNANDTTWDLYMQKRITRAEVADPDVRGAWRDFSRCQIVWTRTQPHSAFEKAFAEHSVTEPDASRVLASLHGRCVTGVISNHE